MDITSVLLFCAGLAALLIGARELVIGSSRLAAFLGIPPLIIGLTVVAFGTSAPELAIAIQATWSHQPGIAVGNIVGSNICNVLIVLGLTALISPVAVHSQVVKKDVPIMIGISAGMLVLALDGSIGRLDGFLLVAGLGAYLFFTLRRGSAENGVVPDPKEAANDHRQVGTRLTRTLATSVFRAIAGLALLTFGSDWLVTSSVAFARVFGVSELVIGLTIVAIGTSLPEIATSIIACRQGKGDLAIGNVIGSNIFNLLSVLGITAAISPSGVLVSAEALKFDIPVMLGVALMTLPILYTGYEIERWEGALFLSYYVAYAVGIFLIARKSPGLEIYSSLMMLVVVPLTALTLGILMIHAYRKRRRRGF